VPQIPLDFLDLPAAGDAVFALEVETTQLVQAVKRISAQPNRAEWVHLQYRLGLLMISTGETTADLRAAGSWPQVISVARSWIPALLKYPLPASLTSLRVEHGKLFTQDLGVPCIAGADARNNEELGECRRHVSAAAVALTRYGVTAQDVDELLREADPEITRLWERNDEKIIRDIATAWQCLASYGVEASAIRRLLMRKSRDLWKDSPKNR